MTDDRNTTDPVVSLPKKYIPPMDVSDRSLDDLVGLDDLTRTLQQTFVPGMTAPCAAVRAPGILLYGESGSGRLRVATAIAGTLESQGFTVAYLSSAAINGRGPDNGKALDGRRLAHLLEELREFAPLVMIIESLDHVGFRNDTPFLDRIDEYRTDGTQIAVIGLIEGHDTLHRLPDAGRSFADYTFEIPLPDAERCAAMLTDVLQQRVADTEFRLADDITPETLFDDQSTLDHRGVQTVVQRALQLAYHQTNAAPEITHAHLETAVEQVVGEQSSVTESQGPSFSPPDVAELYETDPPTVTFDDVGGMDDVIARIRELLDWPDAFPALYQNGPLDPNHGLLLYGPPGTGKTHLARAIATETDRTFYAVKGPEIKNRWYGESERRMRRLFETADEHAPSLLFFDEFDALAASRDGLGSEVTTSLVNTLLTELDGLDERGDVLTIGATNRRDVLDEAVLRPGRLDEQIEIPPPDTAGQAEIFAIHTDDIPTATDVTPQWFASVVSDGVTGAQIKQLSDRAVHTAMRATQAGHRADLRVERRDIRAAITDCFDDDHRDGSSRAFR